MPLQVGAPRALQLVARQCTYWSAGLVPSKLYQFWPFIFGQDCQAPCMRDLIRNLHGQGCSSRRGCSDVDESDGVRETLGAKVHLSRGYMVIKL